MSLIKKIRPLVPGPLEQPVLRALRAKRLRDVQRIFAVDFPDILVEPIHFLASKQVPDAAAPVHEKVESLRTALNERTGSIDFPLGPRGMNDVAFAISVEEAFGIFLHLCASAIGAQRILELGVGGGIGSCYLAMTPSCREFIGVDMAPQALDLASENLRACVDESKLRLLQTSFDDALDQLNGAGELFDFIWLDGDHYTDTTLRYAQKATSVLRPGGILALDDLRWSGGVLAAWQAIRAWTGFSHTIDAGRVGLAIWQGGSVPPRHWNFARALYWPWSVASDPSQLPPIGKNPTK
jgi:predicted O-methyltransferase YrrM